MLMEFLRRRGLEVEVAPDGEVALRSLEMHPFDLLVCDLDMPVMRGDELLRRIAGSRSAPPTLVISGYVDEFVERELMAHPHVRRVFRKPFDVRGFTEVADRLARGKNIDDVFDDPAPGLF